MLVLSRRIDQKVYLQIEGREDIVITVVDSCYVRGKPQVKIGFDAPSDVTILRDDIGNLSPRDRTRKQR